MPDYHVRISREYSLLSNVITKISESSKKFAWYEHEADDEVNRTHIHGILMESSVKNTDSWKNWIKKALGVTEFPSTDWLFSTTYKCHKTNKRVPVTIDYITYMSKGVLEPSHTNVDCNEYKSKWVCNEIAKVKYKEIFETPEQKVKRKIDIMEVMKKKYVEKYGESWSLSHAISIVCDVMKIHPTSAGINYHLVKSNVEWLQFNLFRRTFEEKVYQMMSGH